MARIDWVRQRLENWARWCGSQDNHALGFPSQSAFARLGGRGRRAEASIPVLSIEAAETDRGVQAMRYTHPHLHQVLTLTYAKAQPRDQVARRLARTEDTIKRNLEEADHALARWFDQQQQVRAAMNQVRVAGHLRVPAQVHDESD